MGGGMRSVEYYDWMAVDKNISLICAADGETKFD